MVSQRLYPGLELLQKTEKGLQRALYAVIGPSIKQQLFDFHAGVVETPGLQFKINLTGLQADGWKPWFSNG